MKAPAVMIAANARFSTSVTANCRVKATAAMARTAAVMSPKPTEAAKMLTSESPSPLARKPHQQSSSHDVPNTAKIIHECGITGGRGPVIPHPKGAARPLRAADAGVLDGQAGCLHRIIQRPRGA